MLSGRSENINLFNEKLLIGLLACMICRVIVISMSIIYGFFCNPYKIHIATNILSFYSFLFFMFFVFITIIIPGKVISALVASGSTLLLGGWIFKSGLPYRALLFIFSSLWAYLFVFVSSGQFKRIQIKSLTFKKTMRLKYILLICYPAYLYFEEDVFRNISLFFACAIFSIFFINWLNKKL